MKPRQRRRRSALLVALSASLVMAVTWVPAHGAKKEQWGPRAVTLRTSWVRQSGRNQYLTWSNSYEGGCTVLNADGIRKFPKAVTHQPEDEVKIRLVKKRRPSDASITGYRALDQDGQPVGTGEDVPFTMEAHRDSDGKIKAWHLVFVPTGPGHFYLDVFAAWDDSCSTREGLWSFHIKTLEVEPPA